MEVPMRRSAALVLMGSMIALSACEPREHRLAEHSASTVSAPVKPAAKVVDAPVQGSAGKFERISPGQQGQQQQGGQARAREQEVSLDSAGAAQAVGRKVIQNAEMTIETDTPNEG